MPLKLAGTNPLKLAFPLPSALMSPITVGLSRSTVSPGQNAPTGVEPSVRLKPTPTRPPGVALLRMTVLTAATSPGVGPVRQGPETEKTWAEPEDEPASSSKNAPTRALSPES